MKTFYTDGACSGNPGRGGWGVVEVADGKAIATMSGKAAHTTNNKMELQAAIAALETTAAGDEVTIYTDSKYVQNGITSWLAGWKVRGWKTSSGTAVKNQEQWEQLDGLTQDRKVTWKWVKAHAGNKFNEQADQLATSHTNSKWNG